MKKLILVIAAVALLASPAMAVDWNFYGSARMATFYVSRDYNNGTFADLDAGGLNAKPGVTEDAQVQWDFQTNSRIGATVKSENIGGRFELALKGDGGGDVDVSTRRMFGTWNFGAATLKVGKDYTPVAQFVSGQAFGGDAGLLGQGAAYGSRVGQIALSFGGFEIAAITNAGNVIANISTGNVNKYLPKIEAKFGMSFDTWSFGIIGGYQYYEIKDGGALFKDIDVDAYILGGDVQFNFGPAFIKGAGSFGQNWNEAGWAAAGDPAASYKGTGSSTDDVKLWQAMIAAGFKFTDQLTLEGGVGYLYTDPDANGQDSSNGMEGYVQAVIGMAPGVWLVPEVGYKTFVADYNATNQAQGSQWYLGGKWQIDF